MRKELAAALPNASDERTLSHPAPSSTASAVLGLAAVAVVGATLIHFMSSSDDAAPPSSGGGPNGIADMQRLERENSDARCITKWRNARHCRRLPLMIVAVLLL